jgi:outer membrane biosynthesis protein TonB
MNNNPGSSTPQNVFGKIAGIFNINKIVKDIEKTNILDRSIHSGTYNVPYAFMGLVTLVAATFTYATYSDYSNAAQENLEETVNSLQSNDILSGTNSDDFFGTSDEDQRESQEETQEESQEETQEESEEKSEEEKPEEEPEEKSEEETQEKSEEESKKDTKEKTGGKTRNNRKQKNFTYKKR